MASRIDLERQSGNVVCQTSLARHQNDTGEKSIRFGETQSVLTMNLCSLCQSVTKHNFSPEIWTRFCFNFRGRWVLIPQKCSFRAKTEDRVGSWVSNTKTFLCDFLILFFGIARYFYTAYSFGSDSQCQVVMSCNCDLLARHESENHSIAAFLITKL